SVLAASATAFTVIKLVGAAYLIYLGVRMLFAKPGAGAAPAAAAVAAKPLRQLFMQGFWTNVLNPKVVLFFVSFFPQFVSADSAHKALAFLTLGAVFVVMSTLWNSSLAWVAGSVTRRFSGKPGVKKWLDRTVGSAFVGLGLKLATSQR
ncbi:LysE family translocator, partial [Paraburkholderia sp. Se-20369]|nr:LysE family translocator [Paraburkholderia sp. Se-20369]